MYIHTRLMICLAFCLSFYACSSNDEHKVSADKIEASVKKGEDVDYHDVTITDNLNLIDTEAAVKATPVQSTSYIRSGLVFRNCIFKGSVMASLKQGTISYNATFFKNICFYDCVFDGDVNFEGATINGSCNFYNCNFKKSALFNRATFEGVATFSKSNIMETGGFQQCTFMNSAYFNEAHFYQGATFQNSYFYRDLTFNLANCDGYTDFTQGSFYSTVHFNYVHFKKGLSFNNGSFQGRTEFIGAEFVSAEFNESVFSAHSLFNKSNFSSNLSLKDCKFLAFKPETKDYKAVKIDISGVEVGGMKMTEF